MDRYEETARIYNKIAPLYEEKFMELDLYDDTYDRFCALLTKPGASIFEIACGPGNITRYLSQHRPDFRILSSDVAPNMIRIAQANNPAVSFRLLDARELDTLTERFDGVMCGFCLPYVAKEDCGKLFRDVAALLETDGIAYFSAIEDDYANSRYETSSSGDQVYVYYYRKSDLVELLTTAGLQVVETFRKPYPLKDGVLSTHLILLVRKS